DTFSYFIDTSNVLSETALGTSVLASSLTSLGTIASLVATTADINAGTFDGVVGGTTPAAGSFTTLVGTTLNGNTFTTGTYTLTGQAGKTLTFNGSITLTGTDAQVYTFPTTTATVARTDAAQTFTGVQTFSSTIVGSIDGNAGTVSTITGLAPDTATTQATQGAITSLGTLTSLAVAGNVTVTGTLQSGAAAGTNGQLTLTGSTSGTGVIKVNVVAGTGIVFQIPSANGSGGQFLTTDGAGVTSWATPGGSGDVVGDTASVDKEFVRFNSTTGKIIESPATDLATTTATLSDNADVTFYDAVVAGNPVFSFGSSAAERLRITPTYDGAAVTLDFVEFATDVASVTGDKGEFRFSPDAVLVATIDDGGIELADTFSYFIDTSNVLSETALGTSVLASSLTSLGTIASLVATTADINAGT
ncbi:MAG: hypothetical protein Q8O71_01600, partial [bacterium]|nr:hypothetical protein [bacterium]